MTIRPLGAIMCWHSLTSMNLPMSRAPTSACVRCRDDETTIRRWFDLFAPRVEEVIVCDLGCEQAVKDYRAERGTTDELRRIDWMGVLWGRGREWRPPLLVGWESYGVDG
ncbi:MAG: hypothetical protein O2930_02805 [Acidobacteria bacterium]|nr:hypothetical protein [Acidobacteriota bacterium]